MLRYLNEHEASTRIRNALEKVYRERSKRTRDVGGTAGTAEFADAIIEAMAGEPESAELQESGVRAQESAAGT